MPSAEPCPRCSRPVSIPGLDQVLCSSCGWVQTEWGRQEELRQAEKRRLAREKAKAKRKAKSP